MKLERCPLCHSRMTELPALFADLRRLWVICSSPRCGYIVRRDQHNRIARLVRKGRKLERQWKKLPREAQLLLGGRATKEEKA